MPGTGGAFTATMMGTQLSIGHLLERAERLFPDVSIVSRDSRGSVTRSTYRDVCRRARQLGALVDSLGLGPSTRVGTIAWNDADHLAAYLGIPSAGHVLHTINPRLGQEDLAFIIDEARDAALIVDADLLDVIPRQFRGGHVPIFATQTGERRLPADVKALDTALDGVAPRPLPSLDENSPAIICFTSATTGRPKGVVYSHRSLVLHALSAALPDQFNISSHDTVMPVVPMFHVNAWGLPFTATLVGATQVLPGPLLDGDSILSLLADERVTVTAGVPTVWTRLLEAVRARAHPPDLTGLRTVLIGGSAAAPALIEALDALGPEVLHAWGMTETSPLGSVARVRPDLPADPQSRLRARSTQGLAAPLVDMRAVDDDGTAVEPDGASAGELQIRGPWVTARYLGDVDDNRFTPDGWFCTGDVVTFDSWGYMTLLDRTADLIKSGGEWMSSQSIEAAILGHPAVSQCAVVGTPHPEWVERPVAYVIASMPVSSEELREHCRIVLPRWQVPDDYLFVQELPTTATGKINKRVLRAMRDSEPTRRSP